MAAPQYVGDELYETADETRRWSDVGGLRPSTAPAVTHTPVDHRPHSYHTVKRVLDVFTALVGIVLSIPVLLIAAFAIWLDSPGPVLFRQRRIGWHGKPFTMFKLRTMVPGADALLDSVIHLNQADGPLFKATDDPRVTPVGRLLRTLSIDELPQLWNVVRGDMSLVGPRPALPHEVLAWPAHLHRRLEVRPGITGLWQVSGRSHCSFEEYARHDLRYVDEWSPAGDLVILAKTAPAVLKRRGAA